MWFDLTADEIRRRELMLSAADDFDPAQALADEQAATRLLYSGLDDEQQQVLLMLRENGVLP